MCSGCWCPPNHVLWRLSGVCQYSVRGVIHGNNQVIFRHTATLGPARRGAVGHAQDGHGKHTNLVGMARSAAHINHVTSPANLPHVFIQSSQLGVANRASSRCVPVWQSRRI
ncbi:hypothetical protein E2C01_048930 [Portunus trituberculatus]|uniref:Uncharacterized protein n=1 Tax=Portunus trituberculatus TaxID=210409 RepID=A0A5B7GCU7_PORTR|nr:hypothetical protein [Portunus trituberculatus]